jgi:hypothetical protein
MTRGPPQQASLNDTQISRLSPSEAGFCPVAFGIFVVFLASSIPAPLHLLLQANRCGYTLPITL